MEIAEWHHRFDQWVARHFIDREIIIRGDGRVGYLTVSASLQKVVACSAVAALLWFVLASGGVIFGSIWMSQKNSSLEEQRLAYFDLLTEVSGYQKRFRSITATLQDNQDYLFGLLEAEMGESPDLSEIRQRLDHGADPEIDEIVARDGLRSRLETFAGELSEFAERNHSLMGQVTTLRNELTVSRDDHARVEIARLEMLDELEQLQDSLKTTQSNNEALQDLLAARETSLEKAAETIAALETENAGLEQIRSAQHEGLEARDSRIAALSQSLADMTGEANVAASAIVDLQTERSALSEHISSVEAALALSRDRAKGLKDEVERSGAEVAMLRDRLADDGRQIADLTAALDRSGRIEADLERQLGDSRSDHDQAIRRERALEEQIDLYESQLALLEGRMDRMAVREVELVQRYRERTSETLERFEKTVAMTGLEVDPLLAAVRSQRAPQGGPFIASDGPRRDHRPEDLRAAALFESSLSDLDHQLERWSALQELLATLPLAPPLEQYKITSSFGTRYDPINNRKAHHSGLDFGVPRSSSVYSPAPGTVVRAGWYGHYGRYIEIDHGHGIRTRYAHLKSILVKRGEVVSNRQKIGLVGSSGRSTGTHLHYEVVFNGVPQDPAKFLTAGKYVFKE